jgi:hypothetical protein
MAFHGTGPRKGIYFPPPAPATANHTLSHKPLLKLRVLVGTHRLFHHETDVYQTVLTASS